MTDATRVFDPGFRVTDANGDIVPGAVIKFYDAGGTTPRTVYSNSGLSVSLGVSVTCNAAGCPSSDGSAQVLIYTGTTPYRVKFFAADGTTALPGLDFDNVPGALDTTPFAAATFAKVDEDFDTDTENTTLTTDDLGTVRNGNPTGGDFTYTLLSAADATNGRGVTVRHVGTSGKLTIAAAVGQTIDGKSSIEIRGRYESVTIASDGTNWHVKADANRTVVGGSITPQGYLTLTSGVPVIASDVIAATAVYYTPYVGNMLPLYDGTRFVNYEFSELTLTLASQHSTSTLYDVFAWLESGVVTIGTGPAWSTSTAGSGARGTGAGTTELTRTKGLYLNTVAMTARNSSSTYSVGALRATFLGTISIDSGAAGQITCHTDFGSSRKWGVSNAYNVQPLTLKAGDATASWTYATNTTRASRGQSTNSLTVLSCLPQEIVNARFQQLLQIVVSAASGQSNIGIGLNSTTVMSGTVGATKTDLGSGGLTTINTPTAQLTIRPFIGLHTLTALEIVPSAAAATNTFLGGETQMLLRADWRG